MTQKRGSAESLHSGAPCAAAFAIVSRLTRQKIGA